MKAFTEQVREDIKKITQSIENLSNQIREGDLRVEERLDGLEGWKMKATGIATTLATALSMAMSWFISRR